MNQNEIDENGQRFFIELFEQTKGNQSAKISMFNIGEALGMDRNLSSRTAEELIGWGLAEVKTLSGDIGITDEGLTQAKKFGAGQGTGQAGLTLGDARIVNDTGRQAVELIVADLKTRIGNIGLDFDVLAELMADLKTIDAQLMSPKPKTAVIRECFRSIRDILASTGKDDSLRQVRNLLDE
ncbi:MAG: hypothetical protein GY795_25535 [Desulfobacterales bacterium]|nr:hypothetical protein [Desulfobacterales bacterium]